jgi:quercetin dioxygenase-like cupin family protein
VQIGGIGVSVAAQPVTKKLTNSMNKMMSASEVIRVGEIEIKFLLEAADSNGSMAMFEFTVPAGAKVPLPHSHKDYDETIYGLDGVITFTVEGKPMDIGRGESCFVPRGVVHGFNNLQPTNAKALAVITPALLGPDFFKEMAVIVNAGGRPDVEKLKAVMAKHGLVPALPPGAP